MGNIIYGPAFIEKLRFASYKSTTMAIAEILDNSIDAGANKINVVFVEKRHSRNHFRVTDIYFLDNGDGMDEDRLSKCLIFSEGAGKSSDRIGAFGVGLPSASIYIGKRVEVFSRENLDEPFKKVFLDIDQLRTKDTVQLDDLVSVSNKNLLEEIVFKDEQDFSKIKTIVKWSKIDKLESEQADTLIRRVSRLVGRIYRYKLDEIEILMTKIRDGNFSESQKVLKYDPLFISETPYFITDELWSYSEEIDKEDKKGIDDEFLNHPQAVRELFNAKYYYRKFLKRGDNGEKTQLPLFNKLDGFFDEPFTFKHEDKEYTWKIRATYAKGEISKPGVMSGGATRIGSIIGKKMDGEREFPSSNIYFIRAGREIDCDSYRMYTVTEERNRFWTIEIHFDSDMDELMGLSNDKQSVDFKYTLDSDVELFSNGRDVLYNQISQKIVRAISLMKKKFSNQVREFKDLRMRHLNPEGLGDGDLNPILTPDQILKNYIRRKSRVGEWQVTAQELAQKLKEKYFTHLELNVVLERVELYYANLTKEIVLYGDLASGKLIDVELFGNVSVIIINTNHQFYNNVISVIKSQKGLRYVTTCIEMLLSYMAYEMHSVVENARGGDKDILSRAINRIEQQFSMQIADFISDLDFRIDNVQFEDSDDSEEDDSEGLDHSED